MDIYFFRNYSYRMVAALTHFWKPWRTSACVYSRSGLESVAVLHALPASSALSDEYEPSFTLGLPSADELSEVAMLLVDAFVDDDDDTVRSSADGHPACIARGLLGRA